MKSPPSWVRTLSIALLCALALVPGVLHARICLVALGAIDKSECCEMRACCRAEPSELPILQGEKQGCRCCLDFDLDSGDKTPLASATSIGAHPIVAPACSSEILPQVRPPPVLACAQSVFARAGPRPRMAAPLPLRI